MMLLAENTQNLDSQSNLKEVNGMNFVFVFHKI